MREIRLSGSVEGVVRNHDPYSDCFGELCSLRPPQGANEPKQENGVERAERRVRNEPHA